MDASLIDVSLMVFEELVIISPKTKESSNHVLPSLSILFHMISFSEKCKPSQKTNNSTNTKEYNTYRLLIDVLNRETKKWYLDENLVSLCLFPFIFFSLRVCIRPKHCPRKLEFGHSQRGKEKHGGMIVFLGRKRDIKRSQFWSVRKAQLIGRLHFHIKILYKQTRGISHV